MSTEEALRYLNEGGYGLDAGGNLVNQKTGEVVTKEAYDEQVSFLREVIGNSICGMGGGAMWHFKEVLKAWETIGTMFDQKK